MAGNTGPVASRIIRDRQHLTGGHNPNPELGPGRGRDLTARWSATDTDGSGVVSYTYGISSGGDYSWYTDDGTMGQQLLTLPAGSYYIQVNATDAVGNVGTNNAWFEVDTTAPGVFINAPSAGSWHKANVNLVWYSDETVTYFYKVDGGAWTLDDDGNVGLILTEGDHTLWVNCTDVAGNPGTPQSVLVHVDLTAPTSTITSPATDNQWRPSTFLATWTGTDSAASWPATSTASTT